MCDSKERCLACKHSFSTNEDTLWCELSEEIVAEEETCEDFKGE